MLSDFLHRFDLAKLQPAPLLVARSPGVVVRVLSHSGEAHALYIQGRNPTTLDAEPHQRPLESGVDFIEDGAVLKREIVNATATTELRNPVFTDAVSALLWCGSKAAFLIVERPFGACENTMNRPSRTTNRVLAPPTAGNGTYPAVRRTLRFALAALLGGYAC